MDLIEKILLKKSRCTIEEDVDLDVNENYFFKWNDVVKSMKEYHREMAIYKTNDKVIDKNWIEIEGRYAFISNNKTKLRKLLAEHGDNKTANDYLYLDLVDLIHKTVNSFTNSEVAKEDILKELINQ